MHDVNDNGPIYRDGSADGAEARRAIRHCCEGLRLPGALLYLPAETAWRDYWERLFAPLLAPHLVAVHAAATAGQLDRVLAADAAIGERIDAAGRERARAAAPAVFQARAGARGMRLLERLADCAEGVTFPTAFAAHAAAFHVPVLHAALGYLFVDWRAGVGAAGLALENRSEWEDRFFEQLDESPEPVGKVLARGIGHWAEVA